MKQFIFLSLFLTTFSCTSSAKSLTAQDARAALQNASAQDAQLLLNLAYWSYVRSDCTCTTQQVLFENAKESWMLWLNAASRRRNPRTALPYPDVTDIDSSAANLAAQTQASVNTLYINALTYTIEENSRIRSKAILNYIEAFRNEARAIVAQDIMSALVDLESTIQTIHTIIDSVTSKKFLHNMRLLAQEMHTQEKNLIDDGINYLMQGVAIQSFAQFDKKYITTSEQFFDLLADTQTMYLEVWDRLESTRAGYYQTLYQTIYTTMQELNFPATSFMSIVQSP